MTITRKWLEATDVENAEITEALLLGLGIGKSFKIHWTFGVTEAPVVVAGDVVGEAQGFFWYVTEPPVVVAGDVVGEAQWVSWYDHLRTIARLKEKIEKEPLVVEHEELRQFADWLAQRLDKISDGLESIHKKNEEAQAQIEELLRRGGIR